MKVRGLTLLEVMVALLIFALTGTAVMKAAGDHLNSVGLLEEVTFGTWVANNRMAQVMLEQQWPPRNNRKGQMDMAGRTWYWQQVVSQVTDENLRQVEVRVSSDQQGQNTVASAISFVSRPSQSLSNDEN